SSLSASVFVVFFFFIHTSTISIYTLSLHDALPIYLRICHLFSPRSVVVAAIGANFVVGVHARAVNWFAVVVAGLEENCRSGARRSEERRVGKECRARWGGEA